MIDSRCGRMLDSGDRSMVSDAEFAWIEEQVAGDYDHLLVGTSLPWLLPRALHDLESWDERLASGTRGPPAGRLRREGAPRPRTWSTGPPSGPPSTASPSCSRRSDAATTPGADGRAPATICVLSGDVHHAYAAQAHYREPLTSKVYQLTCSPLHNYVPGFMKVTFRISWNRLTERSVRFLLGRVSKVPPMTLEWKRLCGPYFGDQIATLTMDGRSARVRFEQAGADPQEDGNLTTVSDLPLAEPAHSSGSGWAPRRVTAAAPAASADSSAACGSAPPASAAARAPQKASPAPVVSTTSSAGTCGPVDRCPSQAAPAAPNVTTIVLGTRPESASCSASCSLTTTGAAPATTSGAARRTARG